MNQNELRQLVKESVQEVLKESLADFEVFTDGISNKTMTGEKWHQFINGLEGVVNEVKDFHQMYSSSTHGPAPYTKHAMAKLEEIVKAIQQIKPAIIGMDQIEQKDQMGEGHPHGRYAQQAGATPLEPPQDY